MNISDEQINRVVTEVVDSIKQSNTNSSSSRGYDGVYTNMNDAVEAAHNAFLQYKQRSIQCRKNFIDAIRQMAIDHKEELARMTVEETGMGRVDHKILKYINAAKNSPGVEELQPKAWSGKNGLALDE
ncbi:MAG: aldehyde dehydrogenase family protein, partial [Calditrichaceae bacterium]